MREEKKFIVEELTREMGQANPLVFTDHSKVKANDLNQLRAQLKTVQSRYRVVQNSLFQRALKIDRQFTGPLAIAYGGRDVVAVIKTLVKFAKDNPEVFIIKGGLVDKQYFELHGLEELAKLPSKEVLLARLVGQMNAPIGRFAMALQGNLQKLVCVLDGIAKKREVVMAEEKKISGAVSGILDSVSKLNPEEKAQLGLEIVKNLTVVELSNWVKSLEEEFGVTAAPVAVAPMSIGAPMDIGAAGAGAPAAEEKTEFQVVLASTGANKIQVIKEVRALTNLGLKEAKDLVDGAPKVVKDAVPKKEAEEMKAKLEAAGAKVEIK